MKTTTRFLRLLLASLSCLGLCAGLAGATVLRGLMSYGTSGKLRSTRILDLSADLPVVVEIVDKAEKITAFLPLLDQLLTEAECGGLVTLETVQIISYQRGKT